MGLFGNFNLTPTSIEQWPLLPPLQESREDSQVILPPDSTSTTSPNQTTKPPLLNSPFLNSQQTITGLFFQPHNPTLISLKATASLLIYSEAHCTHYLPLHLTVLEQHFFLFHKHRIYSLKLLHDAICSELCTYDEHEFLDFYIFLAHHCILRNFQQHFTVGNKIGSGSFSNVYEGKNKLSQQEVALKVLPIGNASPSDKLRISNEIITMQKLKAYHLSPLIEVYEAQDCVILVMIKASGNLLDYISQNSQEYGADFVREIMHKLLINLAQLHEAGYIHRDIKPENMLFVKHQNSCTMFLSDFGMSTQRERSKIPNTTCSGTLGFIAPELFQKGSFDEKCDIFSAGCFLYFLITGNTIFSGFSMKIAKQSTYDEFIIHRIEACKSRINPSAYDLLKKMLAFDPARRPSAVDILNHAYFQCEQQCDEPIPCHKLNRNFRVLIGDENDTCRLYIQNKMMKVWEIR